MERIMQGLVTLMALVILGGLFQGKSIGHGLVNPDRFSGIVYRLCNTSWRSGTCHEPRFIHHYLLMLAAFIFPQVTVGCDLSPR